MNKYIVVNDRFSMTERLVTFDELNEIARETGQQISIGFLGDVVTQTNEIIAVKATNTSSE